MAEGQVFDIPEGGFEWFRDKMKKLAKQADKLTGAKLFLTVIGYHRESNKDSRFYNHKIMEVFVAFPEPKLNGWTFVARIDHANEVGNIIRTIGDHDLPERFRHTAPVCDHCNWKRKRRDSFIVFNTEFEEYKQVGTSCLKDFLGHGDAEQWSKVAEMIASIGELARTSHGIGYSGPISDRRWYSTEDFCVAAAESVLRRGWVSKKYAEEYDKKSTAEDTWLIFQNLGSTATRKAVELAERALEWARGLSDKENMTDYEHNCNVVAKTQAMEARSAGIAASIVGVYYKNNQTPKITGVSKHLGIIGQVYEGNVVVDIVSGCRESPSVRHVFKDEMGNVLLWFASSANLGHLRGKKVRIKGTVKAHTSFQGVTQTLINRVKVVEAFDDEGVPESLSQCALYR